MTTFVDIYNDIFKFHGKKLFVIVDKMNTPWFYKNNVLKVLGYNQETNSVYKNISI